MEANELRLENIIYSLGQKHEGGKFLGWINYEITVDLEVLQNIILKNTDFAYSPIPLTEEWILKFGCRGSNGNFLTPNRTEILFNNNEVHFIQDNGQSYFGDIFYVHEFQNAVFVVEKEELIIKTTL